MPGPSRRRLPQLAGRPFLTDGGIETTLIFHEGVALPDFAAFDLLRHDAGRQLLERYYRAYLPIAARHGAGFILESATWRASRDWGERLGYSPAALAEANAGAMALMARLRDQYAPSAGPLLLSGCVGPRGDGYVATARMTVPEAEAYHAEQVRALALGGAEFITAITMTYVAEAVGIVRAARAVNLPVVISFTVETDGCLPTGDTLEEAIAAVDLATGDGPAYYMINCAHPSHFGSRLRQGERWTRRIRGLRANASRKSHAELNESADLDSGDPVELGREYRELCRRLPWISVLGGCCGTDHRHLAAIAEQVLPRDATARSSA